MNNTDEHLAKKQKTKATKNSKDINLKNKNVNIKSKKETATKKKTEMKKKEQKNSNRKNSTVEKKKATTKKRQPEFKQKNSSQNNEKQKIEKLELNKKNTKKKKSFNRQSQSKERLKNKNSQTNHTKKIPKKVVKKRKVQKNNNILEIVKFIIPVLILVIILVVIYLKTASHTVDGDSMNPTLLNGDRVIVTKGKKVERYEIITFDPPTESDFQYVKRVIGMPDDSIWITGNHLFINPKQNLKQSYSELIISFIDELPDGTLKLDISDKCVEQLEGLRNIPEGKYFVLGDNRENSSDSREFGLVDEKSIEGAVSFRTGPLKRFGLIK